MQSDSPSPDLAGRQICLTGRFASMTQAQMAELIRGQGGQTVAAPNRSTAWLVIGQDGFPLLPDGQPTQAVQRGRKLQAAGQTIEFLTEAELLERLGIAEAQASIHRRYTVAQLAEILGVPGARIRTWARAGLIQPVETVHRLAYFDFQQVTSARALYELAGSGVGLPKIRAGLEQLRGWLPDIEQPLSQLDLLERNGRLLVRLVDGRLAEPGGQLQLDFMRQGDFTPAPDEVAALPFQIKTVEQWFEDAMTLEDLGQAAEAMHAYRQAAQLEPNNSVLRFSLGNALYASGAAEEAAEEFRQAVRHDPGYVEAWNNLGNVLAELGDMEPAIEALQHALRLVPTYADAHYNLADLYHELGRSSAAAHHWRCFLRLGGGGPWAERAQRLLGANRLEEDSTAN